MRFTCNMRHGNKTNAFPYLSFEEFAEKKLDN